MGLPAFDTLEYAKELEDAGCPKEQAEAQAKLNSRIFSSLITEKIATRDDIAALKNEISGEFGIIKDNLANSVGRGEFKQTVEAVKWELTAKIDVVSAKLNWLLGIIGFLGLANILHILFPDIQI